MSDTRPGEFGKLLHDEEAFKIYMIREMERSKRHDERIEMKLDTHIKEDDRRFNEMEKVSRGVSSSVDDYNDTKAQFTGAWKALTGLMILGGAVWACVQALAWLVEKLKP